MKAKPIWVNLNFPRRLLSRPFMQIRLYSSVPMKWFILSFILLAVGCYEQPSAERLDYDADAVQTLRQEIKSVDWDE